MQSTSTGTSTSTTITSTRRDRNSSLCFHVWFVEEPNWLKWSLTHRYCILLQKDTHTLLSRGLKDIRKIILGSVGVSEWRSRNLVELVYVDVRHRTFELSLVYIHQVGIVILSSTWFNMKHTVYAMAKNALWFYSFVPFMPIPHSGRTSTCRSDDPYQTMADWVSSNNTTESPWYEKKIIRHATGCQSVGDSGLQQPNWGRRWLCGTHCWTVWWMGE